jgi:cytochrome c-type biogenesis protein
MAPLFDGSQVNLLIALLAGFITFFASCLLPLVPTYLAYLSGVSLNTHSDSQQKWQIFRTGLAFVIGFIITFIVLGLGLNQVSSALITYKVVIEKLAGILFITLGLFMLGIFKNKYLAQERKFNLHGKFQQSRLLHALLTGIAFGFGWSPCIGPVLAVILFWAAQAQSAIKGTMLLTAYGVGLGIPFLIIALGFEKIIPWLKKNQNISKWANYVSAIVIILAGIFLILGKFQEFSLFILYHFGLSELSI